MRGAGLLAGALALTGCAEREVILPGERLDLRDGLGAQVLEAALPVVPPGFAMPRQIAHAAWTHTNGTPAHAIQHPALSAAPVLAFAAPVGQGDSRGNRIAAPPVSGGGVVYALDAGAGVAALDARSGALLWRADVSTVMDAPSEASGGGLALEGGTLYVASAFGTLTALDARTGRTRWTQDLEAAATGAPMVADGLVHVVGRDGQGWAVETGTGRVAWRVGGVPDASGVTGPAGPALGASSVFFPFSAGDVVAAERRVGTRRWQSTVAGGRQSRAYRSLTDLTGMVVVSGDTLYAGNATGRIAALDAATGERRWTAREGAQGPVWPAAGSVFAVTDEGAAVRLDAATGDPLWRTQLPTFGDVRARRRKAVVAHYGPVLAGGRLWIASSDGVLRGLDPAGGAVTAGVPLPGGAASAPIVVSGVMYVMSKDGRLLAYR